MYYTMFYIEGYPKVCSVLHFYDQILSFLDTETAFLYIFYEEDYDIWVKVENSEIISSFICEDNYGWAGIEKTGEYKKYLMINGECLREM